MNSTRRIKMGDRLCFVISGIQRLALYETKSRFYLVGSNNPQTKFRVLNIDRTQSKTLEIVDDEVEYTNLEIKALLDMVEHGNKKLGQKGVSGFTRTISAFGILGFVKFLEGYYIILITKRRRVGLIGHHSIYKIEETYMNYIPNDTVRAQHPDEARYVKMFQNIDLSSNFYFSYSYDLTHTLQYNLTLLRSPSLNVAQERKDDLSSSVFCGNQDVKQSANARVSEDAESQTAAKVSDPCGIWVKPCKKFTWNWYLLEPILGKLHTDWILPIIHGFIEQSNISLFGKPIYVTLVARRSNKFAGTRFLKRGATACGDVANEVETEQIVFDASLSSLENGHFSAFVQTRGSIPFFWSQGTTKMVPKPPIIMERSDPFCSAAGRHFNQLFYRHGSPVMILNLVKKREKKKHESILSAEFQRTLDYLNQFLPPQHRIIHIGFDMAKANKSKEANVLSRLSDIAYDSVRKTGIFHTRGALYSHHLRPDPKWIALKGFRDGKVLKQTGVIRVNCVDCLDRTNTAQFAVGKVALAFQLYALGVLESPTLEFDSDCVRMLEELYEGHGDTLALQYGGSQLVHRIKTYRKTAPWTSQSRDIVHTLSRYYSNTFSDADKQNAINIFLGVFRPADSRVPIWELLSDYYLHHSKVDLYDCDELSDGSEASLTRWWDRRVLKTLPLPYQQEHELLKNYVVVKKSSSDEQLNSYLDYYRPFEFTVLSELFAYTMSHSVRDFMPNFTTNFSPFAVRVRPGKRREELGGSAATTNPSVTGQSSSTSSTSSSGDSSSSGESSDFEPLDVPVGWHADKECQEAEEVSMTDAPLSFAKMLPSMMTVYGVEPEMPSKQDLNLYRRYTHLGQCLLPPDNKNEKLADLKGINLIHHSTFPLDSSSCVTPPTVHRKAKDVYKIYVQRGTAGASDPYHREKLIYQNYMTRRFQ